MGLPSHFENIRDNPHVFIRLLRAPGWLKSFAGDFYAFISNEVRYALADRDVCSRDSMGLYYLDGSFRSSFELEPTESRDQCYRRDRGNREDRDASACLGPTFSFVTSLKFVSLQVISPASVVMRKLYN